MLRKLRKKTYFYHKYRTRVYSGIPSVIYVVDAVLKTK